jgi:hypothetical protein
MEGLMLTALCGAMLAIIGFGAVAIDWWQQRHHRTDSK